MQVYGEEWHTRRLDLSAADDEECRLRLHVYPYIGHMALGDVRPRHIRDLVNALKNKLTAGPKREKLAPRTVRSVFALLRLLFRSAVIDEHITTSPVMVEKGVLPKNVDKDPAWRPTAIFEREELIALISHPRIASYRHVGYALEGVAGVRHGEMAGVKWRDYYDQCKPLGKLVISRSGEKDTTKTQVTREIPVHPTLAAILDAWKREGWAEKYGREPTADDLILPTEKLEVRKASNTLKHLKRDLIRIGLRARRGHDLRRTFVTLAQADGGRRDVLRPLTHPGEKDIVDLYTTFPWPVVCAEILKLRLPLPNGVSSSATSSSGEVADETQQAPNEAVGSPRSMKSRASKCSPISSRFVLAL